MLGQRKSEMYKLSLFIAVLALALVGCSKKSVDGTWDISTSSKSMPPGTKLQATFSDGSKMHMTMDMKQPLPTGGEANIHADIDGSYTFQGDIMELHADSVKFSATGVPADKKAGIDAMLAPVNEQTKNEINKEGREKYEKVDENTFTLTGTESKETFTRAK